MPSWWGKFSSKEEKKKTSKEGIIDAIQRKFKAATEDKRSRSGNGRRRYNDTISERGSLSRVPSRSPSPSKLVSRCQSFVERPVAQPLPLPKVNQANLGRADSGTNASSKPKFEKVPKSSPLSPLPSPRSVHNRLAPADADIDLATASVSSSSSTDSDEISDSRILSPMTSDYENGIRTAATSPSSVMQKDKSPLVNQKSTKEAPKPVNIFNNQILSTSPKQRHIQQLQIPHPGAFSSAPDSSMSSPSRSPMRAFGPDAVNPGFWTGKLYSDIVIQGSGQCSSPGSGHNSGHNSVGGDMSGQLFWPLSRCSPECSPIPSPRMTSPGPSSRMTSPGPSSRIQSGAVTPLHPRAVGAVTESSNGRADEGKQQSHRLPLPPIAISKTCPFSPSYSTSTSPSVPRSPGRVENPASPGSRWKKGRLIGRGTFGHVYLAFNSDRGGFFAVKEVTLFSDDPKTKESTQQLKQEISLLSRLRHDNIVRYYGCETVDDKLYIYLEYVSGGSIYKILQEYGQLGESAIRTFTRQILLGLEYLHAKNTVHRDIKGANILLDPSGSVKLADFGMAKHITGQSCPLSFKGSPYWMAPEVIKNSSGSGLAVDIWSLGCTVLEMATTKPPWSQYEGVAAMFKIGNSKELPLIPDHLSEEGKDFVRKCLQRDPLRRPTAAQLLQHPFVIDAPPLDKTSDYEPIIMNTARAQDIGQPRIPPSFDCEVPTSYQPRSVNTRSGSSDAYGFRNISCPVSPIGSPILQPRSPQHPSGRLSPSPISSPHTASGSSTPITGGSGAIPFYHPKHPTYLHESIGLVSRAPNSFQTNASNSYQDPKLDLYQGVPLASHAFREIISSDHGTHRGALGNQFRHPAHGDPREFYDRQPVLADHVSQQLLRDHAKLNRAVEFNTNSLMLGRTIGK